MSKNQYSFPKDKIKIALLEGISKSANKVFNSQGYKELHCVDHALSEDELCELVASGVHVLGVRSKTQVTKKVLDAASNLLAVGCYCIGTNQVDLDAAAASGVAVFNAPYSNTRSVAELTIAEVVCLARRTFEQSQKLHEGIWQKSAVNSFEVKNKVLGIVGYGHIGPQVGLLAEALGMKVNYFDLSKKLPLSNARQLETLEELLSTSDFVTLHVPETEMTKNMISEKEIALMRKGSYLLNLSRGSVVNIEALAEALKRGDLAGAAVDVYPKEPSSNSEPFESVLQGIANVILTPHVGGSTEEAQENIGIEVSQSLVNFVDSGSSSGSVNLPQIDLPVTSPSHRVLSIHKNIPGVLSAVNGVLAEMNVNVESQWLSTKNEVGYLVMDVSQNVSREIKNSLDALEANIKTRLLF